MRKAKVEIPTRQVALVFLHQMAAPQNLRSTAVNDDTVQVDVTVETVQISAHEGTVLIIAQEMHQRQRVRNTRLIRTSRRMTTAGT
jgi:hypothetical protein